MIYNYKSNDLIQTAELESINDLYFDILDEYNKLKLYSFITLYITGEIIYKIFECESRYNMLNLSLEECVIEYMDKVSNRKNDIFILSIAYDGNIYIDESKNNFNVVSCEGSSLTYIHDTKCKTDMLFNCGSENILCFCFENELINDKDVN